MSKPQFIQARHFTRSHRTRVDVIVMHTMQAAEKPGTASAVARWFAGANAPQASAHYCVDASEVVHCVAEHDIAWQAPGCNHNGIGIELAGYAEQSAADWTDPYSDAMLRRAAELVAGICRRWHVPVRRLSVDDLRAGARGLCGHVDVSKAFGKSNHWDPGPNFPWPHFLQLIESHFTGEELDALDRAHDTLPAPPLSDASDDPEATRPDNARPSSRRSS